MINLDTSHHIDNFSVPCRPLSSSKQAPIAKTSDCEDVAASAQLSAGFQTPAVQEA